MSRRRRGRGYRMMQDRIPGTPAQEAARAQAWAAFRSACARRGVSRSAGTAWLADQIGIDIYHCKIHDMDEIECATVVEICGQNEKPET